MFTSILYTITDGVAKILINRPTQSNALADETFQEIIDALALASEDPLVKVVLLSGVGKNFSAGGDIVSFHNMIEDKTYLPYDGVIKTGEMGRAVKNCLKPVIAMVNGAAAGAGAALALACDFRVMSPNSKLIMSFIQLGLTGDTGAMFFLNAIVGNAKATEIMANGQAILGEQAEKLGLTTKLVAEEKLEQETELFAQRFIDYPTQAFARQKKLSTDFFFRDLESFTENEARCMVEASKTEDFAEAVEAFLNKRTPHFKGK